MTRPFATAIVAGWALAGLSTAAAQAPSPSPSPSPAAEDGKPKRLQLDVDKQVEEVMRRHEVPRFETSVEVVGTPPQVMLERHLRGFDMECGPAGGGAPTEVEMRQVRHHPSPYVDFLALGNALLGQIAKKKKLPDRYFLYRVQGPTGLSYTLRDQRMPPGGPHQLSSAIFELVEGYPDLGTATRAWRRLERGGDPRVPTASASPLPPWVTSPCRPPK